MRVTLAFFTGFIAGMLFLVVLLWRYGSLQPVRAAVPAVSPPAVPAVSQPAAPAVSPPAGLPLPLPAPAPAVVAPQPPPIARPEPTLQAEVPDLLVPVQGADASKILDTFDDSRDGSRHEAADIMAPRGTPVLAVAAGTIEKLFHSRRGGITIYQFDPGKTWCFYYAHLDRYAEGLHEKMTVRPGQVIGYVGSTGDASPAAPHLHFAIFKLGPEKKWWKGMAINPYPVLMRRMKLPR